MRTWHAPLNNRRADRKVTLRLFGFVLVSIALHGVVLLAQQTPGEFNEAGDSSTLQVTLNPISTMDGPATPDKVENKTRKNRSATATPVEHKKHVITATQGVNQPPITATTNEPPEPAASANTAVIPQEETTTAPHAAVATVKSKSGAQLRITLKQQLKRALAKQFYYPLLASKRGWQGQVLLAFSLDTRGTIINARIAQGSGYRVLDRAALTSLNKVAMIDAELSQPLSFELPVIYNLNGG